MEAESRFCIYNPPSSASSDSNEENEAIALAIAIDGGHSPLAPPSPVAPLSPSTGFPPRSPTKAKKKARTTTVSKIRDRVVHSGIRTLYTAGRPPWYDSQGQMKETFVVGLCGGSASGKTTVARKIIEALDVPWVTIISMDSFYKVLTKEQHEQARNNEYDFDHPDSFDFDCMHETLKRLKEGKSVEVPVYNFQTHRREKEGKTLYGANVVIFEGIMTFSQKKLLELMDMKIFVDTDSDIRLARRLKRDISERARDIEGVLKQYHSFVKPSFEHYIAPTMCHADIIVPRGGENQIAINLIVRHIHSQLMLRGFQFRSKLANSTNNCAPKPDSLYVLETTPQIQGLHTFIRNKKTSRDEFIFYSKRLMRLLIEYALSLLPHKAVVVATPQGIPYEGKKLDAQNICGVSILRAGETMEPALCEVLKDIRIGKILIQTNFDTGEPELHYLRLPRDIKDDHVMLIDATVATGAAAMMAIRVLLDHDVPEESISLLSLLMADSGVHTIAYAFPRVKIITTAIDHQMNDEFHILPGIGNFGDRYFGTEIETET